jgi:DNA-directed RNA polymerase specialized sigma24 family protein
MARIEDIERRLLNWARWRIDRTSGVLGYAAAPLAERVDGEGWDAHALIPTVDCEASDTEVAVQALEGRLKATVEMVYVQGGGMRRKAERLCCSEATVHARIDEAHRKLSNWFTDRQQQREAERERVQQLQRLAAR